MNNANRDPSPARDWPRVAPPAWDQDLWLDFKYGAIYEDEVPRDFDGNPLLDEDGVPTRYAR
jgi:hypothetical protein